MRVKSPQKGPPNGQILLIEFLGRVDAGGVIPAGIFPWDKNCIKKNIFVMGSGRSIKGRGGRSPIPGFPFWLSPGHGSQGDNHQPGCMARGV